jgi:hypothetical protein
MRGIGSGSRRAGTPERGSETDEESRCARGRRLLKKRENMKSSYDISS